ncbi:hypothetical protein B0H15DRAFT_47776 [Mycena belliarum]|uniref:Uncharacterized protein n=1 Tax=Mycena belliarum TaxID=1033014 RepID=A0AAD6XM05_9AGAR|nr:hypothetical protein B0H15DRAFT_47776 [Mycena belliae]
MSAHWCLDECLVCDRVLDGPDSYCSPLCQARARPPPRPDDADQDDTDDDDDDDDESYADFHRVALWAQNVAPTPPAAPATFTSPSKRILTTSHPTSALSSDAPARAAPHPSPPRPARTSPTATESLVASSTPASPLSLGSLVRAWAGPPRPHLARLTTSVFAKTAGQAPPPPSDETSDGDVSPGWWALAPPPRYAPRRPPAPRARKPA